MGRYCYHTYWCKSRIASNHLLIFFWGNLTRPNLVHIVCLDQTRSLPCILLHSTIMSSTVTSTSFPMPSASADLGTTWAFLQEGVDHIMTKLQTGVSYSKANSETPIINYIIHQCITVHGPIHRCLQLLHIFQDAWKCIRDDWNRKQKWVLFEMSNALADPWPNPIAGANLIGSDLYNHLIRYFVEHLKGLRQASRFHALHPLINIDSNAGDRAPTRWSPLTLLC